VCNVGRCHRNGKQSTETHRGVFSRPASVSLPEKGLYMDAPGPNAPSLLSFICVLSHLFIFIFPFLFLSQILARTEVDTHVLVYSDGVVSPTTAITAETSLADVAGDLVTVSDGSRLTPHVTFVENY